MSAAEAAKRIGRILETEGIEYAIGGAIALGVWGAPRATNDVDLSVFATDFERVADAFERIGLRFDRADAARGVQRIGFFKGVLGHVPVDVFMSGHPHFFEMQRRRRRVTDVDGTHLYFISPEDVCITKLLFGRDKDIADLERLFAAQRSLDLT